MVRKSRAAFNPSSDRTPKYTVKTVGEMLGLSAYTIRYYENIGLIPFVDRTDGNMRLFSDYTVGWLRLVHCLRATGLPVAEVKHYIALCLKGDETIPERAEIIFKQEKLLREQIENLQNQMVVLKYKKSYYTELLESREADAWNPLNDRPVKEEPALVPHAEA